MINANGTPVTGDFQITAAGSGDGNLSRRVLAYDPGANRFLVGWRGPSGQFVRGDGSLSGSNFSLALPNAPAIAFSPVSNRFLAVAQDNSTTDLSARLVDADGTLGTSLLISAAPGAQREGTVRYYAPTNQFLVAWHDGRNGVCCETFGRYVDPDGMLVGEEFRIQVGGAGNAGGGWFHGVAYSAETDRFLVTWTDVRQGCCSVFGQIIGRAQIIVAIDIKPGSFPNSINLGSGGTVPVAILSSPTFDAATIDPTTITLASAPVALKGKGTPMASLQDVNGDGLLDLVVHVDTSALQLSDTDAEAVLEGKTFDDRMIRGTDSVRVVP